MARLVARTEEPNGSGFRCAVQYAGRNGYRNINIEKLSSELIAILFFIILLFFNSPNFFLSLLFFFARIFIFFLHFFHFF